MSQQGIYLTGIGQLKVEKDSDLSIREMRWLFSERWKMLVLIT